MSPTFSLLESLPFGPRIRNKNEIAEGDIIANAICVECFGGTRPLWLGE
jgi:hypothetical protein